MLSRFHPRPRAAERCPHVRIFQLFLTALLTTSLFFLPPEEILAQANLVDNPSIEANGTPCPTLLINNLPTPWSFANLGKPDWFNTCNGTSCSYDDNNNIYGDQAPAAGAGYAGIVSTDKDSGGNVYREYLQGHLTTPMSAGQTYMISFQASLADISPLAPRPPQIAISSTSVNETHTGVLSISPIVNWEGIYLNNTTGWTTYSIPYKAGAGGTDQYIIIGNFDNSLAAPASQVNAGAVTPCSGCANCDQYVAAYFADNYSYVYIDSVSVESCECGGDAMDVLFEINESDETQCCYAFDMELDTNACDIYGIKLEVLSPDDFVSATVPPPYTAQYNPGDNFFVSHDKTRPLNNSWNVLHGTFCLSLQDPPRIPAYPQVRVTYLDYEGNELCTEDFTLPSCRQCDCDLYDVDIHNLPADENECCFGVDLDMLEGACDVADIEVWINGGEVPSTLSPLPWPMLELQSRTNAVTFCLSDSPGTQTVEIHFIDEFDNVICTKLLTAECPCACLDNQLDFTVDKDDSAGDGSCCYDIYVTNTRDCDVETGGILIEYGNYGVSGTQMTSITNAEWYGQFLPPSGTYNQNQAVFTNSNTGNLLPAGQTIHLAKICIDQAMASPKPISLTLLDDLGNPTCTATPILLDCDDIDCCDQAMVNVYPAGVAHDCCFDFDPILPPCYTMGTTPFYANVRVCVEAPNVIGSMTGISTSPQCLFFNNLEVTGSAPGLPQFCFTAPPDEPRQNVTFTFLDSIGQVICEKTVTIECYELEDPCCGDFSIYTQDDPSYFGPLCCKLINVYQDPMSSCVVGSIELQGPEVGGGLNPVTGGAIHNPGSPPAVLPGVTVGAYCPGPGQSGTVKIIIRDNAGNVLCVRYIDYDCPAVPPSPKQGFNDAPELKHNGQSGHDILSVMPQPASSEFNVSYSLSREAEISLTLFDELGIPRAQLDSGMRTAGQHSINFDASGLSSGVYFLRLDNGIEVTSIPIRIIR